MPTPLSTRLRALLRPASGTPSDIPGTASATAPEWVSPPAADPAENAAATGTTPSAGGDGALPGAITVGAQTVLTTPNGTPTWVSSAGPFPPDRAFDYGTIDGSREIDKEHFESYLEKSVDEELGRARLAEADAEAALWREREAEAIGASAAVVRAEAAEAEVVARIARAEAEAQERVDRAKTERDRAMAEAKAAEASVQTLPGSRGSVLFAVLYTLAALVFILGDIGIAQSTVADGLELTGWHGVVFAVGLGLLSVLLKPVYDRLVEDPYHEGRPGLFVRVITTVSLLTLGALLVLGYFRSESYVAGKNAERAELQTEEIADQIEAIEEDTTLPPAVAERQIAALESQQAQATTLQAEATESLTKSTWGRLSFILSGLLFAVAGAVCLGIGLKHITDWYYLRRLPMNRARSLRDQSAAAAAVAAEPSPAPYTDTLPALRAEAEQARARAAAAWPLDTCRDAFAAALAQRAAQIEAASAARREKLVHLYRDGYELGLKNPADYDSGLKTDEGSGLPGSPRRRRERPFLEIRRAIARQSFGDASPDPPLN